MENFDNKSSTSFEKGFTVETDVTADTSSSSMSFLAAKPANSS